MDVERRKVALAERELLATLEELRETGFFDAREPEFEDGWIESVLADPLTYVGEPGDGPIADEPLIARSLADEAPELHEAWLQTVLRDSRQGAFEEDSAEADASAIDCFHALYVNRLFDDGRKKERVGCFDDSLYLDEYGHIVEEDDSLVPY